MSANLLTPARKKRPTKLNRYQYAPSRRSSKQLAADGLFGPAPQRKIRKDRTKPPERSGDPLLPGQPKQTIQQLQDTAIKAKATPGLPVVANTPRFIPENAAEDVSDSEPMHFDNAPLPPSPAVPRYPKPKERARRSRKPRPEKTRVFANWTTLLPDLHEPYLQRKANAGDPARDTCPDVTCTKHIANVTCVFWDKFEKRLFRHCEHSPLAKQIVAAGLFPSAPDNPRYAFCVDLLDFYFHLFHHSADSATAAAASISAFHRERGYVLRNRRGQTISEGYKRPLQFAIQWYDILKSQVEGKASDAVREAANVLESEGRSTRDHTDAANANLRPPESSDDEEMQEQDSQQDVRCSERLRRCCPLCFEELTFGRSVEEGMDIHVAVDANFNQRHNAAAGDCPPIGYEYVYLVTGDRVVRMEERLQEAGKRPPRPYRSEVPEEVVAGCNASHEAGDPSKHKTAGRQFDDKGILALVCQHDAPLCFVNVTDPGEGQKYALAALEWLFEELPDTATVTAQELPPCTV